MLSPLQLKQHSLLEIRLKERESCTAESTLMWVPEVPIVEAVLALSTEDPKQYRIIFSVISREIPEEQDQTIPAWDFVVRLVGYFEFDDPNSDAEKSRSLTFVNGTSILYGIARDLLYGLSLRGQKPSILLPSMNFTPWGLSQPLPVEPTLEAQEPAIKTVRKVAKKTIASGKTKS